MLLVLFLRCPSIKVSSQNDLIAIARKTHNLLQAGVEFSRDDWPLVLSLLVVFWNIQAWWDRPNSCNAGVGRWWLQRSFWVGFAGGQSLNLPLTVRTDMPRCQHPPGQLQHDDVLLSHCCKYNECCCYDREIVFNMRKEIGKKLCIQLPCWLYFFFAIRVS